MSICEIFPDDPSCVVTVTDDAPVEDGPGGPGGDGGKGGPGKDGDMMEEGDHDGHMKGEHGHDKKGDHGKDGKMDDGMVKGWGKTKEFLMYSYFGGINTSEAQMSYLIAAWGWVFNAAIKKFRYTSATGYWDGFRTGTDTNYNKLADDILQFGTFGVMGTAAIT